MAHLALTIVGAAVGNAILPGIGGPIGAALGSTVAVLLFPQKTQSPPAQEVRLQTASYGTGIPIIHGSSRTEAIIWDGSDTFTRHAGQSGGKGGGSQPTPDSWTLGHLRAVWCESSGTHRAGREWHNGRIVADDRVGNNELPEVFYDGASDQSADPTEEALYGVGNRSAYRHVASSVYTDLQLDGAVLQNINREIIEGSAHTDKPLTTLTYNENSAGHAWPYYAGGGASWTAGCPAITAWPEDGTSPIRVRNVAGTAVYTYDQTTLANTGSDSGGDDWPESINNNDGDAGYLGAGHYGGRRLYGAARRYRLNGTDPTGGTGEGPQISTTLPVQTGGSFGGAIFDGADLLAGISGLDLTDVMVGFCTSEDEEMLFLMTTTAAQYANDPGVADKWYKIVNDVVIATGSVVGWPEVNAVNFMGSVSRIQITYAAMFENDYKTCWVVNQNSPAAAVWQINDAGEFRFASQHSTGIGNGGLSVPTEQNNSTLSIYALASGCKCGVIGASAGGKSAWLIERCDIRDGFVRLSDIVDFWHAKAGQEDVYDTSELIDIVRGLRVKTPTTPRAVIESLQDLYGFTLAPESRKYVKLGKPSILTIPDEDLCAHDENGSDIPSPLQVVLGNDIELPEQIFFSYLDYNAQYQVGVQNWHRQHTQSSIVRQIGLDITLTAKEAKQMVTAIGERTIREADKYTFYLLRKAAYDDDDNLIAYTQLEASDVVTVKGLDLRITNKVENQATGVLKFEAVRSHPGVVIQTGAGGGESDGIPDPSIPTPQETELLIGDWPWITDDGRQRVLQVAMAGALRPSWRGAQLNKSTDGGSNYGYLLADNVPATMGETLTALPNFGGGYVFDESARLDVEIHPGGGALTSATRRAVLGGANYAMVGAEMIQFRDAELTGSDPLTYRLSGLLRGRHGTQWAMRGHAIGDIFCLLPTPLTIDALPTDYGFTRHYKAVTIGRSISTATAYPFRSNGVSLAPYSPVQLGAGFVGDPGFADIAMRWRRRTRLGRGWVNMRSPTGQDSAPLGEATEAYRVRIWEDGTFQTVVRVIDVTTTQATYTAAMQVTDFGDELTTLPAWSVAQIGALGPGYEMYSNGLGAALPLFVPTDSGGYTPPIPPPSEAIDDVMTWSEATTIQSGAFGPNDAWVIQFTTGSTDSGAGGLVRLQGAEFGGPPAPRQWTLSPIAGDFGPQPMPGAQGSGSPSVTALFVVGSGNDYGFYPTIPQSTTWYLNIRNQPSGYLDMPMFCTLLNVP